MKLICAIRKLKQDNVCDGVPGFPWDLEHPERRNTELKPNYCHSLEASFTHFIMGILTGFPSKPRGPCWRRDEENIMKRQMRATKNH